MIDGRRTPRTVTQTRSAGPRIPRWVEPRPGAIDENGWIAHRLAVPAAVAAAATGLAARLGVPESTLHLAAHLKVLAVLTGEARSGALAASADGSRSVVETTIRDGRWVDLLRAVAAARSSAAGQRSGTCGTVVADASPPGGPVGGPVLHVWWDREAVRLWGRPAHCDAGYLDRLAGYHLAALRAMVAAPDSSHDVSLVGPDEAHRQVHHNDSAARELPTRRAHTLFEEQAERSAAAPAVSQGGTGWTYGELNRRANRVAHRLLASGLPSEGVVAVLAERTLDWAAAVVGVLKAGGVYLPVDPSYPAERVATMLERSGARAVLSALPAGAQPLAGALEDSALSARVPVLPITTDAARPDHDRNPAVPVPADAGAYVYFTSGSTGRPKGALCEHGGMLNHLLSKVETLELTAGSTVAQSAPICFDISLWQLIAPLLVGGRVEIVAQSDVLDVGRFVETLARSRATVAQVVPSYLDVVLQTLARDGRSLPDLRYVSVTGEALDRRLVDRWFARFPGVPLVNAYGATEVSDDTNHAVLTAPPPGSAPVPLGKPIRNVAIYVVDERLRLVPTGAPGEIVVSGTCVGRGYVNDPERTAAAFCSDPFRPGRRLYRTGDHGRWLPGGDLEFLGRRDDQVKVRGIRIEPGEIERRITEVPGVVAAAVVARESGRAGKSLVAFYVSGPDVPAERVRATLSASLPGELVPVGCHRLAGLPLTENGKTDKRALAALAEGYDRVGGAAPRTPTERELGVLWAELLGRPVEDISRADDFFDTGGTSLAAAAMVVRLGRAVSLADLLRRPVLCELAELLDQRQPSTREVTT